MVVLSYIFASLAATICVQAGPIEKRGTVGNDVIVGLAAAVPSGTVGTVYTTYQPYLKVWEILDFQSFHGELTKSRSPMDAYHSQASTPRATQSSFLQTTLSILV